MSFHGTTRNMSKGSQREFAGFSLIEAMVSLVVLSVGMIGIAAMYGQGLGAGRTALYRTQAVNFAADMADRIRVNRRAELAYNNAGADRSCDPGGATNCAPQQMAEHDNWVWNNQIAQQLPNGVGAVNVVAGTPATYTITVTWQEVGLGPVTETLVIGVPNI